MSKRGITVFSWGYEGWGNWTGQLVQAADSVEKSRGYGPPLFVDIRARRGVRAEGFRDKTFERRFGPERYRWIQGLGNKAILTGARVGEFVDAKQAELLLDLVVELQRAKRRAIFFCSCASPTDGCHRHWVAPELFNVAKRRDQALTVVEWPGYESEPRDPPTVDVEPAIFKAIVKGSRKSVPIDQALPEPARLALPWWTPVRLNCGSKTAEIVSGPAQHRAGGWQLPFLRGAGDPDEILKLVARTRKELFLLPRAWPSGEASQAPGAWQPRRRA